MIRFIAAALLASTSVAAAQTPAASALARVDSLAAHEYAKDSAGSLTIGVVTASGLQWTKSYGYADVSAHRPAIRQTVYRIGSITKMFTGLMLQQLVAEGKIQLSDPVERYYPEIKEVRGYEKLPKPTTVVELATMTSGLAREPEQEGPFWTGPVSTWDSTLHLALPHTNFDHAPGPPFVYSNIGYAILGATLGRAAGVPYVQWETQHILQPLGMQHSAFEIVPQIAADVARGYDILISGQASPAMSIREGIAGRGYKVPNGALFTTVDDLSKFLLLQLGLGPADVVPQARLDSAYRAVIRPDGTLSSQYGIGFSAEAHPPAVWYGHNGGVAGYTSVMLYDRDRKVGVIVLRSATGGSFSLADLTRASLQAVSR
jgi:D-alanyl-D-alanine carboxypeptidase